MRKFECQVLDREKKSGWLWDTYKVTLRIIEPDVIVTWEARPDQYYDMPIGSKGMVTLYQHSDGRWYPMRG